MKDRLLGEKIVAHIKIEPSIHQVEDVDCNRLEKQLTAWCFERLSYFKVSHMEDNCRNAPADENNRFTFPGDNGTIFYTYRI